MKKIIIILFISLLANEIKSQLNIKPDSLGLNYYIKGTELLKQGDYPFADSLLTLALNTYRNENVFINRAIARLALNDTIGFCEDVNSASTHYFDPEAEKYFNTICCSSVDTIYYDKKGQKSDENNFRYYEIIQQLSYTPKTIGVIHDKKYEGTTTHVDIGPGNQLLGIYGYGSDVIANYIADVKGKYYNLTPKPPKIINIGFYNELKIRAKTLLTNKYNYLKSENNLEHIKLYYIIYINESGEAVDGDLLAFPSELKLDSKEDKQLRKDLLDIIIHYPKTRPAKLFKKPVPYVIYDSVEF